MNFYLDEEDSRKKEFVAFRVEKPLFERIKAKAQSNNSDLSATIRDLVSRGLLE
jgi:hypothetical protein